MRHLNGREPAPLPDPALEQLRQVFHGPDAPADVPMAPFGDLALLPDRPSQAKLQELRTAVQDWLVKGPGAPPRAISLEDSPTPVEPRVFLRGNPNNPGEPVPRRLPALLASVNPEPFRAGSGRLELARAIVDRKNPLTARVLVNRVWMHHFGSPLVATPGDFGTAERPADPSRAARPPGRRLHGRGLVAARRSIAGSCFRVPISSRAPIAPRLARRTPRTRSAGG